MKHAQSENQEPVAFDVVCDDCGGNGLDGKDNNYRCAVCKGSGFVEKMLYTTPPAAQQRKPLTDEQIGQDPIFRAGVRFAEAAHGIKENT